MNKENLNIAMVAPSLNAYSETFIRAQKERIKANVFYYFGGFLPLYLENYGRLTDRFVTFRMNLKRKLGIQINDTEEKSFVYSLKKNNIQLVLAQYGPTANRVADICKSLNIPLITHFHGYDASVETVVKDCNNYEKVFSYSSYVIAVSLVMRDRLIALGCPKDKVIYNVYGPHPDFEAVEPKFSKKQFLAIGRFTDKKAPYYTIMAFKKVVEKHPDAILHMAGEGDLLNMCKNLVKQYGIINNVHFLGVITPMKYRELLKESFAFVQHSITANNGDMEGTPLAVLEASAAGLPVIATNHAGIPDVVLHNETGLLCKEHDIDTMSGHMLKVLNDVGLAKQLGDAGKQRIKEHFSLQRHIDSLQKLLIF
ncbi:glycosyltransferase [Tamlana flava]|uniref:glycosyltransferase n=1 Tax=Tamlana flava TaxID=3158572 RepID=UPI00351BC7BB